MEPATASALKRIGIVCGAVIAVGVLVRFSPWCIASAGPVGWKTWARVYPNLACSLHLSAMKGKITPKELEERLDDFTNLRSLDLSGNGLTQVPRSVYSLTKLETLALSDNALTSIDAEIGGIAMLESLDVSGNKIQSLPSNLGNLQNLVTLNVSNNELTGVPPTLSDIETLTNVDISENALDAEDEEEIETSLPNANVVTDAQASSTSSSNSLESLGSESSQSPSPTPPPAPSSSQASASSSGTTPPGSSTSSTTTSSEPPISPSSESFSSLPPSAPSTSSTSPASSTSSAPPDPGCTPNFSINDYHFCIPATWVAGPGGEFTENGSPVAKVTCPLQQSDYNEWQLTTRSRTFQKNGTTYGADLWSGTPKTGGGEPLLLVFMHKNDFASWFGENYADVGKSCQIESMVPLEHENVLRLLYLSVQ